jgi:AhpD family alkylhydroperoxidase
MEMNDKIRELIAIGASITANCQPCLQSHVERALSCGADHQEVTAAIEIGHRVQKGAAARMEAFSASLQVESAQGFEVVIEGNGYQFLGP